MTDKTKHIPALKDAFRLSGKPVKNYALEKLDVAVNIVGSYQEKARLSSLVNRLAKSPAGKDILKQIKKGGYSVGFASGANVLGVCDPDKKTIVLTPSFTDDRLIGTLAHEGRHSIQFQRDIKHKVDTDTIKTQIMVTRAMEADAQTNACLACWELKNRGDEGPWNAFKFSNPEIAKPFEEAAKKAGARKSQAMTAAFKGWYDNIGIKQAYEESYFTKRFHAWAMTDKQFGGNLKFERDLSGSQIVRQVCEVPEGNYFRDNPKVLEQGKFLDVAPWTKKYLENFMKIRKKMHKLEPDKTLASVPVRATRLANAGRKANINLSGDTMIRRFSSQSR